MKNFESFTNLYSLSRTLRFELRPIGSTRENIEKNGLLLQDEHRAESYKKVKRIIDRYHKAFMDASLGNVLLPVESCGANNSLEEVRQYLICREHTEQETTNFDMTLANLRKAIAKALKEDKLYTRITNVHKKFGHG